ncbi:hypothetical protein D3C77_169260 [compost metagenome]
MAPGVVDTAEQEGEAAATVGEAQAQGLGQGFEGAGENQREDAELGFRRHGDQPGQHPLLHALAAHHVPRMHQQGDVLVGAMVEECYQAVVIQIVVADVVADLHADVTAGLGAAGLAAGGIDILQRNLGQHLEAIGGMGGHFHGAVIHQLRPREGAFNGLVVAEHHRGGAHHLDVQALFVEMFKAADGVPEHVVHRAEGLVAEHDLAAPAFGVQPGRAFGVQAGSLFLADGGEEVGMDVDFHEGWNSWSVLCQVCQSRPGWIAPHSRQRRSSSLVA